MQEQGQTDIQASQGKGEDYDSVEPKKAAGQLDLEEIKIDAKGKPEAFDF